MARLIMLCAAGAVLSGAALVRAEPLGCLIQPFQEAEVGTQVVGVLDHVMVERGDFVKKGQPLASLNSDVERAAVASAKVRAESYAELQAAASNHDFAQKKRVRTQDLYRRTSSLSRSRTRPSPRRKSRRCGCGRRASRSARPSTSWRWPARRWLSARFAAR